MKQRDEYDVDIKVHNPRAVNLICDATFYGKRKDRLGDHCITRRAPFPSTFKIFKKIHFQIF